MKTATFKYQIQKRNQAIYGKVTLKDDGKISISLINAQYGTCYADRYQAKELAKKIVAADFKHEAVTSFTEVNASGLVEILKVETAELKTKFIAHTKEYARNSYKNAVELLLLTPEQLIAKYGETELKYPYQSMVNGQLVKITKALSKHGQQSVSSAKAITGQGFEKYEADEVKFAEFHYERSIYNLALRLNKKGIKDDTVMTIKTATIGAHITTTIEHENTITKAWTIIASGEIQRPHYRYLVK